MQRALRAGPTGPAASSRPSHAIGAPACIGSGRCSTSGSSMQQQQQRSRTAAPVAALSSSSSSSSASSFGSSKQQKRLLRKQQQHQRASSSLLVARSAATEQQESDAVEEQKRAIGEMLNRPYKYGFQTMIESDTFPKGLNEDVVRAISAKKAEPEWMLEFRLRAFRRWQAMEPPVWSDNEHPPIDFQDLSYYSAPKIKETKASLDEVDPELLRTFDKLGIPLNEQKRLANVAVDAVFDSVSIATTFREELKKAGVIFCSISEAVREYPDLVKKYLGSVVPAADNYYAALNSAVFSDGSFVYVPQGVRSPMELSTYFRINASETGQVRSAWCGGGGAAVACGGAVCVLCVCALCVCAFCVCGRPVEATPPTCATTHPKHLLETLD